MTRTKGSRNAAYELKRTEMLRRIMLRLAERESGGASLRELATAAGVSFPTIQHYFGDREGVIAALMAEQREQGRFYLEQMAATNATFPLSVREAVSFVLMGFHAGVGALHSVGLAEGLQHPRLGESYTSCILDPSVEAVATRLSFHISRGEMQQVDPRHAALLLLSPLILAGLHQHNLGGARSLPIDLEAFAAEHVGAFVRAWEARGAARKNPDC